MADAKQEQSSESRVRKRNGRPDFTKISSMPDVMVRPDEREAIRTFTNLSATTHHVRQHPNHTDTDRTMHNLRAIISPTAAKRSLGTKAEALSADLPFTMVESDSENSKASNWSPLKQPKKSCMKQKSDFGSSLHSSTGILEAPSYARHVMSKKKESRWEASKLSNHEAGKGDQSPSLLKTPKRLESMDLDLDDFSLPSLATYQTDDLTLNTSSTPTSISSRRNRKLSDAIPQDSASSRISTVLERKLEKTKEDNAFMSPPASKETLKETSWSRKDITKSISESSPHSIGEELQSAVASLSDHSKRLENDVPLCPDIRDRKSEKEQATIAAMQESVSTIVHSNVSSKKTEKKERRSRSRSRSKSKASSKQRGRSGQEEGSTKQRGRSIGKEKSRKIGKSAERKGTKKDCRELSNEPGKSSHSTSPSKRRSSARSSSPKKGTKLRSGSAHRRACSRSASPKKYAALPAPSQKYRSKSRSKSKERIQPLKPSARDTSKTRSPSPAPERTSLKSSSRHKSRSSSPTRRRSKSGTVKKRSKSRSESPKRVRSKSRSKPLKAKEAKQVIGDCSTHKKKTKKRSASLKAGSKHGSWESVLVPISGLLPPKSPVNAEASEASKVPVQKFSSSSSHSKSKGRKKTLSEASLGASTVRAKDWKSTHEPRKPLSCQLLQKSGSTGALVQHWEEKSVDQAPPQNLPL